MQERTDNLQKLKDKVKQSFLGGGKDRIERQKKLGKKTARDRLDLLLDFDSFEELDQLVSSPFLSPKNYGDGVITGFGKINGEKVAVYAQDFSFQGGSLGQFQAKKICKIMDIAAKIGCPIIGMIDSGGARIEEGIHSLAGYGEIFKRNVRYSGVMPQISLILGPCAGGAVYSPALTDFIFTTKKISQLFITGPQVIKEVLHQEISKEELGGTQVHSKLSGVSHFVCENEEECFDKVKKLLAYLPNNYLDKKEANLFSEENSDYDPSELVPEDANKPYDVKKVIGKIFDKESFLEIQEFFAPNIVTGFSRLDGETIGIVANQPKFKAGTLDIDASCKAARFIQICDSFSIPIISLVDIPGFLPGIDQEHNGIIRHGAKLLYAYSQATVPKISLILRKAFGGAYIVMGSKHLGADLNFAWPYAQIAVMGAKGAISILHRKQLSSMETEEEKKEAQAELEKNYESNFLNPFTAVESGYIDSIIEPKETRKKLISALKITETKVEQLPKKKHGNIPL